MEPTASELLHWPLHRLRFCSLLEDQLLRPQRTPSSLLPPSPLLLHQASYLFHPFPFQINRRVAAIQALCISLTLFYAVKIFGKHSNDLRIKAYNTRNTSMKKLSILICKVSSWNVWHFILSANLLERSHFPCFINQQMPFWMEHIAVQHFFVIWVVKYM